MVVLNYTGGEINAKIVYYGPGVSGKTTNLEHIHEKTPANAKGKMVSMKTQTDRTLFFDFLPLELGEINGYRTRFLLYTVPGQVYYNATRKLVLKGADAIVFVADSSRAKLDENLESLKNLEQNLNEHGMSLDETPWVIQYNKRDVPDAMSVQELNARLNPLNVETYEAVATHGTGVFETLHGIATRVYGVLQERLENEEAEAGAAAAPGPAATAATPAVPPLPQPVAARAPQPVTPASQRSTPPQTTPAPAPVPEMAGVAAAAGGRQGGSAPGSVAETRPGETEREVDDAIDMALRETPREATALRRAAGTPQSALRATETAPAPPLGPRGPGSPADAQRRNTGDLPVARPDRPEADNLFESIPDSPFDHELGRVPSLDEASAASDSARDAGPDEFVTDPMRRNEPSRPAAAPVNPAPAHKPVAAREAAPPVEAAAPPAPATAPAVSPAAPAPDPVHAPGHRDPLAIEVDHASPGSGVEVLRVPVRVTRAQLERGSSFEIVLSLEVIDG